MPATARVMIGLMAVGLMAILAAVALHLIAATAVGTGPDAQLLGSGRWFVTLEGVRRTGVSTYLLAIAFGPATIVQVFGFQAVRLRGPARTPHDRSPHRGNGGRRCAASVLVPHQGQPSPSRRSNTWFTAASV